MAWLTTNRPGVRTSTNLNPFDIYLDIDESIREINPWLTPLQTLSRLIGRGKPPKSHKVLVRQYFPYDNFDFVSSAKFGNPALGHQRLALLTIENRNRIGAPGTPYYYPQDMIYIVESDQVVMVVANEETAYQVGGQAFSITDPNLFGDNNPHSTTPPGTILVRTLNPVPIKQFQSSDIIIMGRTIWESQPIGATPKIRDFVYDCNFVEHKEAVIEMTQDQKEWVETRFKVPNWEWEQEQMINEFKREVEMTAYFSEREVETVANGRLKRHMRGLIHTIQTNRAFYDPATVTDFEALVSNFLYQQVYRYQVGSMKKLMLAGPMFLYNFNRAFREYRRTSSINAKDIGKEAGLDIQKYIIPGGYDINIVRNDIFRLQTKMEHWAVVIDPTLMEWRVVKDYKTRPYNLPNERDYKLMVEWQGTVAWHLEQAHALLATI